MGVFTHSHVFLTRTRSHTCCIRCAYVLPSGHARCLHFHISVYVFPGFLHIDGLSLQLRDLFFQWRAASPRMLLEFPRLGTSSLTISACAPRHRAQERRTFPILRLAGLHVAPVNSYVILAECLRDPRTARGFNGVTLHSISRTEITNRT